jgi:hypothetical protein
MFVAACNPYRKRKISQVKVGIPSQSDTQLAFRVFPPPFSMIELMWDYQQLS